MAMKLKITTCAMLIVMLFSSCIRSSDVEIGFLIHSLASSRWQMDVALIQQRAVERGAKVIIKNADGDENQQLKQAHELLQEGVDVIIVVAANQNTAAGIVRDAHKYNVPVISYDRIIRNADLDYLISFEYEKIGELMVEYVAQKKPNGNCILLWGDPSDANARFIKTGHEKAMDAVGSSKNVNIIYKTFVEDWSNINAQKAVDEILDFFPGKIDAIISSNDRMALGAYDALAEHGYKPYDVLITGQDASLEACRSMVVGGMTMSVFKPIKELAYGAVDLAIDVAKGKKIKSITKTVNNGRIDVPAILFPPLIVDKSNLNETVIATNVFSREQIFN
jgi:D-xylose transport system substrate-binding protein